MVQITCPKCNTILSLPNKYTFDGGCPRCGSQFRIRNGKAYEQSEIVNNTLYTLAILFANIAKKDDEHKSMYFSSFDNFVSLQELTKSQFNDLNKTFKNEYKNFLPKNLKKLISDLKITIDESFKTVNLSEQQNYENSIYLLLHNVANCTGTINEEQKKILDSFATIFEISKERALELWV